MGRISHLPKAELHVHLDGSLRATTMLELARERGVPLPGESAAALTEHMLVRDASGLDEYLERFELTLSVMQDAEALERIACELVLDHAAEGVRYLETRFCPALSTRAALGADEVVEAVLAGLRRGEAEARSAGTAAVRANLIVCGLRSEPPVRTTEMAELAIAFHRRGVCGFDLAGAESGHPVKDHVEAFDRAATAEVPITIHAGEGFGPESIRQAVDLGHARRIGHGTRLHEDRALLETVRERGIPLEVCLTSNVQTRVVASLGTHPARRYLLAGIPISLGTDNRLMSGVTLTHEYEQAHGQLGVTWKELVAISRAGFEHAFVSEVERLEMLHDFDRHVQTLG